MQTTLVTCGMRVPDGLKDTVAIRTADMAARFPGVRICRIALEAPAERSERYFVRVSVATHDDVFTVTEMVRGREPELRHRALGRAFEAASVQLARCSSRKRIIAA